MSACRDPASVPQRASSVPLGGPIRAGLALLAAVLLGVAVWASVAPVSGVLLVPGRVEGTLARLPLQHPDGGRVAAVLARDGDLVQAGTPVLRLEAAALEAELRQVADQRDALHLERLRLEAERDGRTAIEPLPDLAARLARDAALARVASEQTGLLVARDATASARRAMMERRTAHVRRELAALSAEDRALAREHTLILRERDGQEALVDRGASPVARVAALDRELVRIDRARAALAARQAEAEGRLSDLALEVLRLDAERRESALTALGVLLPRLLALDERAEALARQIDRLAITAPVSGTLIASAAMAPGTVLAPGEAAAVLVPADVPLQVVVHVPAREIGSVWPGQPARVQVPPVRTAVPVRMSDREHPPRSGPSWLSARVTSVSADTAAQGSRGGPAYRVQLSLMGMDAPAGGQILRAGLPVEVAFDIGSWSARSWFVRTSSGGF